MKQKKIILTVAFIVLFLKVFSQNNYNTCLGDTIYFNSGLKYYSTYLWNFDDGNYSYDEKPYHIYNQTGTYNASVNAFDACCPNDDTTYTYSIVVTTSGNCSSNLNDSLEVFPNPTSDLLYITYFVANVNPNNTTLNLTITELNTANIVQVLNLNPNLQSVLIDASNFSIGYYTLSLIVNNGMTAQKLFYKN